MEKVGSLIEEKEFSQHKTQSIQFLKQQPTIIDVLHQLQLPDTIIEEFWVDFLNYYTDHQQCDNCSGLDQCSKLTKGMKKIMTCQNNMVQTSLEPCTYGEKVFEDQMIIRRIVLKNVDDNLLLTKTKDLTMVNYNDSNAREILKILANYIENPSKKGFYLKGNPGIGKSTLFGWLIRVLASRGHVCGYVHFPTFLMDLKGSFGDTTMNESVNALKNIDYLVIDDIGGEYVSTWSRDEILSSVLAYRSQNNKPTFFTSVYSLKELKRVYSQSKNDEMRVNRLLDRINALSEEIVLNGPDLR